jgi:hypothetical protein
MRLPSLFPGTRIRLTFALVPRYTARVPIQFFLPKKFTRTEIEWHVDELALKFQRKNDRKIIAQISALNRLLAKMDGEAPDRLNSRNRQ